VPFLRARFPKARLDQARIDLRFALASLGYRGGLKVVEQSMGLRRDPAIQGVDGFEAIRLWHCYWRGDRQALRKLILYNLTDVVNMVGLVETTVSASQQSITASTIPGRPCRSVFASFSSLPRRNDGHPT
jgi:uncharacterized protein YprB with RNaseH-like and TPR domain